MTYQIVGLHKFAEQDDFEQGCIGPSSDTFIDVRFVGNSAEEVISKAREFVGVEDDAIERNACDEMGRIDFAKAENEEGYDLTPAELIAWKEGKGKAFYCVYSGYVEQVSAVAI